MLKEYSLRSFFKSSSLVQIVKQPLFVLILLFSLACLLRFPGIQFEMGEFHYCDEDLFIDPAIEMLQKDCWVPPHFKSGGVNFLIPKFIGAVFGWFSFEQISADMLRWFSRLFTTVIFASSAVFPIYGAIKIVAKSNFFAFFGALIFAINPFSTSASTWFYPDGYIAVFSALVIYLSEKISLQLCDADFKKSYAPYVQLGVVLATAISVKYNAIILCGYPILSLLLSQKIVLKFAQVIKIIFGNIGFYFLFFTFLLTLFCMNYGVFVNSEKFLEDVKISHYVNSQNYFHGWKFYFGLYFLYCVGFFPVFIFFLELIFVKKTYFRFWIKFLFIPIVYIFIIGRYSPIYARNLQIILPFLVVFVAINLFYHFNNKIILLKCINTVVSVLLFFILMSKTIEQTMQDFKTDSRIIARDYVKKHNMGNVYANCGCGQSAIVQPASMNPDFILLDSWFGGINERAKIRISNEETISSIAFSRHFRDLHYLNHTASWCWNLPISFTSMQNFYELETIIRGGGPVVAIFRRRNYR